MPEPTEAPHPVRAPRPRTGSSIPTRILVFGMIDRAGRLCAGELHPVAEACGLGAEQIRSCLRRLVAEGLLVREGVGRAATFQATAPCLAVLGASRERLRLAWQLDREGSWDGRFHLAAFAIPERRRPARDALRDALRRSGGASVHGGLYVSAHDWSARVEALARELGVCDEVSVLSTGDLHIGGVAEPRELAERLWNLSALGGRWRAFNGRYEAVVDGLIAMHRRREALPDAAFLPGALEMAVDFTACFEDDPLLPGALLPTGWPGRRAREIVLESRRLALEIREAQGRPALFHLFDETLAGDPS